MSQAFTISEAQNQKTQFSKCRDFPDQVHQNIRTSSPKILTLRDKVRNGFKKTKWKFLMAFAIKRRTPSPPLMALISIHFFLFFLLQLNLTYMKRILHLVSDKNITLKSSYNWFKIDIRWLLRPPTAVFSHVHSRLNY